MVTGRFYVRHVRLQYYQSGGHFSRTNYKVLSNQSLPPAVLHDHHTYKALLCCAVCSFSGWVQETKKILYMPSARVNPHNQ